MAAALRSNVWVDLSDTEKDRASKLASKVAPYLPVELSRSLHVPLAQYWADLHQEQVSRHAGEQEEDSPTLIVSVSGMPGTGKTTLSRLVCGLLREVHGKTACSFSLDDLYKDPEERLELAKTVHPLLETRGVPGTHDVGMGIELVERLRRASQDEVISLPRFNKLADRRHPEQSWPQFTGRPAILLVEGWFWGAVPATPIQLESPFNDLEVREDPDGRWRRWVNEQLGGSYQQLFSFSHSHLHLQAPDLEASIRWKTEQVRAELTAHGDDPDDADPRSSRRFLQLFERVGRRDRIYPEELVAHLNEDHGLDRLVL